MLTFNWSCSNIERQKNLKFHEYKSPAAKQINVELIEKYSKSEIEWLPGLDLTFVQVNEFEEVFVTYMKMFSRSWQ